jgi:hypothetical protein
MNAFYVCSSLTEAYFPVVTSIRDEAFAGCANLIRVILGTITEADFSTGIDTLTSSVFPGNLRVVYFAQPEGQRAGTYTRVLSFWEWVKEP